MRDMFLFTSFKNQNLPRMQSPYASKIAVEDQLNKNGVAQW